ncbi:MAG: hypothetical protein M0R17_07470 [Candidatus Omnitrophica bacterium]|jgi:hypothetical protein|nr:hypothetical protein [Candidatus Omnitrophota bacterium]
MIELRHVDLDPNYSKKWNNNLNDFIQLYKDGKKISNTLYRIGGMGGNWKDGYMVLLKHLQACYPDSITKNKKAKLHLESLWCIIDQMGVEKVECENLNELYHDGGLIYNIDRNYYNIETKERYGFSFHRLTSTNFIFLDKQYDEDASKRGILKINIHDGTTELFQ